MKDKTNAMRFLEKEGVKFAAHSFFCDKQNPPSAPEVAKILGQPPEKIFKTLVTTTGHPNEIFVFVVRGNSELDLKKAARAAKEKSLQMLKAKDLFSTVGYVHGGCSPLAMKKAFPVFIDEIAQLLDAILISAGEVGRQIEINPQDLARVTNASFCDLEA